MEGKKVNDGVSYGVPMANQAYPPAGPNYAANQYAPPNVGQNPQAPQRVDNQMLPSQRRVYHHNTPPRDWTVGLCECGQPGACCEAFWCTPCQIARQCNMLENDIPEIHCGAAMLMLLTFIIGGLSIATCALSCHTRSLARKRYNIDGTECNDCCCACCCTCCVVNQVLREMNKMGDSPGATCCCSMESDFPQGHQMY